MENNYLSKAFIDACKDGNFKKVKELLKKGIDVNSKDEQDGCTAIEYAIRNKFRKILIELVKSGAQIDKMSLDNITLIMLAVDTKLEDKTVCFLIDKSEDINKTCVDGNTALMYAAINGKTKVVRKLLDKGANVEIINNDGTDALMCAAMCGKLKIVKLLQRYGADFERVNYAGNTAFMFAVIYRHFGLVKYFIEKGIDINQTEKNGRTPLMLAVFGNCAKMVKLLLKNQAKKNVDDLFGRSALYYAEDTRVIRLLQQKNV